MEKLGDFHEWYPIHCLRNMVSICGFNGVTPFPRRAGRLAEENFGVSGNQKIWHGSDFLVALLAVEGAGGLIEVGYAGEKILGSRERERFDVGEEATAESTTGR